MGRFLRDNVIKVLRLQRKNGVIAFFWNFEKKRTWFLVLFRRPDGVCLSVDYFHSETNLTQYGEFSVFVVYFGARKVVLSALTLSLATLTKRDFVTTKRSKLLRNPLKIFSKIKRENHCPSLHWFNHQVLTSYQAEDCYIKSNTKFWFSMSYLTPIIFTSRRCLRHQCWCSLHPLSTPVWLFPRRL